MSRSLARWNDQERAQLAAIDVDEIYKQICNTLSKNGPRAFTKLSNTLRAHANGSRSFFSKDLSSVLSSVDVNLNKQELRALSSALEADSPGLIDVDYFQSLIKTPLSPEREELVVKLFEGLKNSHGYVHIHEAATRIDTAKHPDVMARRRQKETIIKEFLDAFDESTLTKGVYADLTAWILAHTNISNTIPNDQYFAVVMQGIWHTLLVSSPSPFASYQAKSSVSPAAAFAKTAAPAIQHVLKTSRQHLFNGGVKGFLHFNRLLRALEVPHPGYLSSSDLKTLTKECRVPASDNEIRALIEALDPQQSGRVSAEIVLNLIHEPMDKRREFLVSQAFMSVANGSGSSESVDPQNIVQKFNSSQHPDVLSQRKSADQVYREFLNEFEVSADSDGRVSRDEWNLYFRALSSTIDNDAYFELLMKNCWGVGFASSSSSASSSASYSNRYQTQSANTTPAQGQSSSQTYRRGGEEGVVTPPWAVTAQDSSKIPSEPQQQQQSNQRPQTSNGKAKPEVQPPAASRAVRPQTSERSPRVVKQTNSSGFVSSFAINSSLAAGSSSNNPLPHQQHFFSPQQSFSQQNLHKSRRIILPPVDAEALALASRIRKALASRGIHALCNLAKALENDTATTTSVYASYSAISGPEQQNQKQETYTTTTFGGWKRALKACQLDLADSESKVIFEQLDRAATGKVYCDHLLEILRGDTYKPSRQQAVREIFAELCDPKTSALSPQTLMQSFEPGKHPDVLSGNATADQVTQDFVENFNISRSDSGVTFDDWDGYQRNISAAIDNDSYFFTLLSNIWAAPSAALKIKKQSGLEKLTGVPVRNTTDPTRQAAAGSRLILHEDVMGEGPSSPLSGGSGSGPFSSPSVASSNPGTATAISRRQKKLVAFASGLSAQECLTLPGDDSKQANNNNAYAGRAARHARHNAKATPAGLAATLSKIRSSAKASDGVRGVVQLCRNLRSAARVGPSSSSSSPGPQRIISLVDLKRELSKYIDGLTDSDVRQIINQVDYEHSGNANVEDVLDLVRGVLEAERLALVRDVFDSLDTNNSGLIDPEVIMRSFVPASHPDVLQGKRTPDDILQEFLETFDIDNEDHGKVSFMGWEDYLSNVSVVYTNDEAFRQILKGCWRPETEKESLLSRSQMAKVAGSPKKGWQNIHGNADQRMPRMSHAKASSLLSTLPLGDEHSLSQPASQRSEGEHGNQQQQPSSSYAGRKGKSVRMHNEFRGQMSEFGFGSGISSAENPLATKVDMSSGLVNGSSNSKIPKTLGKSLAEVAGISLKPVESPENPEANADLGLKLSSLSMGRPASPVPKLARKASDTFRSTIHFG